LREVKVPELPKCDFCDETARYDGKTVFGPWAYMCDRHLEEILKVVPSEEDLMRAYPSDFPLVEPKPGSEFDGTQLRDEDVPIPLYVRMDRAADRMEGLMNESEGDVALIFREMRDHYLHLSKYLKLLYELDKKRGWF